jgi:DNA-directed RNA polymerase specialized sigma24 family protein
METECQDDRDIATLIEVEDAFNNLSDTDLKKIKLDAAQLVRSYGAYAEGRGSEDLIHISIERIYNNRRKWPKNKTDFLGFFHGVMKSIASHWKKVKDTDVQILTSSFTIEDGDELDFVENLPSNQKSVEEELIINECLESIENLFENDEDEDVLLVITELREHKEGPEIQRSLGITQTQYQTIIRRMRRKLEKEGIKWRPNVREN